MLRQCALAVITGGEVVTLTICVVTLTDFHQSSLQFDTVFEEYLKSQVLH